MAMDWIERVFHVSPDAGTGALELLFVVSPIAALLIGLLGLFSIRESAKIVWFIRSERWTFRLQAWILAAWAAECNLWAAAVRRSR